MKYIKLFEGKKLNSSFVQAAKRGSNAKIKEMIKKGVDINIKDYSEIPNNTALMESCQYKFLLVEKTLLEAGADPNIQNFYGRTALMMASTMKAIDILLEYNADINIQNVDGDTAIMEYLDFGFLDNQIITIIEKFKNHKLNLDLKNRSNFNFYEKSKYLENKLFGSKNKYTSIIKYMDEKFPKYKEEWELNNDIKNYNV